MECGCNCRVKELYPLNGICLSKDIIYKAKAVTNSEVKCYIGARVGDGCNASIITIRAWQIKVQGQYCSFCFYLNAIDNGKEAPGVTWTNIN